MTLKEALAVVDERDTTFIMYNASVTRGKGRIFIEAPFTPEAEALTVFEIYADEGLIVELDFDYDYFVMNGGLD
jgi:hypothetical protein